MFSDLVVHPSAEKKLAEFVASPSHAVLLSGKQGIGKALIAVQLAAQLLGFELAEAENQPYFRTVTGRNGTITIEQIRELITFFRLSVPGKAKVKRVAVIQDADQMGTEAQNALLKLLEEPPTGSVLLLTSSHVNSLLPTIRSRTQIVTLPSPSESALVQHFTATGNSEASVHRALLRYGSDIAAIHQTLNNETAVTDETIDLVKKVLAGTTFERLLFVDGLAKQKEAAKEFVTTLSQVALVSVDAAATKKAATLERWQQVLQAAYTAGEALQRSGNAKLVLTELMLSL